MICHSTPFDFLRDRRVDEAAARALLEEERCSKPNW